MRLNAKELRITKPPEGQMDNLARKPVYLILDNVLDTYNIGSIFRLADAVAASEVILCGGCDRPPSHRIHKAAVGTEEWVKWKYFENTLEAIKDLRATRPEIKIIAVEQDARAISLERVSELDNVSEFGVVVGHETHGVSKEVLNMADVIVEIPMWGINKSLNVHVSAAIVVYKLLEKD